MKNKKKILFIAGFYLVSFVAALLLTNHVLNYDRIHPSKPGRYVADKALCEK